MLDQLLIKKKYGCNKNELSQKLTEVGIKLLVETIPLISVSYTHLRAHETG